MTPPRKPGDAAVIEQGDTYQCADCHGRFVTSSTKDAAESEARRRFPYAARFAVLCDDCYQARVRAGGLPS